MNHPIDVLLIEDSPGEARLLKEMFTESQLPLNLTHCLDGEDGLNLLQEHEYHLLILDLNLPGVSGWDILHQLKKDPARRMMPIVVLTSSKVREDVLKAYDHHANCYIQKPTDLSQFRDVVKQIENFWFGLVTLPLLGT
jgi:chemotaxis family two-component system response regulator Rcp1